MLLVFYKLNILIIWDILLVDFPHVLRLLELVHRIVHWVFSAYIIFCWPFQQFKEWQFRDRPKGRKARYRMSHLLFDISYCINFRRTDHDTLTSGLIKLLNARSFCFSFSIWISNKFYMKKTVETEGTGHFEFLSL